MVSVEEDDLAGLEDVKSDGEDDKYGAELTDNEIPSTGASSIRRPHRKRVCVDTSEKHPLMEGEGRSLCVMGFNKSQRAAFVQIFMRFGVFEDDWGEFSKRLKQKSYDEINYYGILFLRHLVEDLNDSPTFSDGVPKEGLRTADLIVRWQMLSLFRDKAEALAEGSILFEDDIILECPELKEGKIWKEPHDCLLIQALLKHGYGRWQAIVDDKDLNIKKIICQELNLPVINTPAPGTPAPQNSASVTSQALHAQASTAVRNGVGAGAALGATNTTGRTQPSQENSAQYHFKDMQRRQVEFIKKRVLMLEKGLIAEVIYADDEYVDDMSDDEEQGDGCETSMF